MANNLKDYPNAIFEAWNEPQNTGTDPITPEYLTYLTTMYNAVRSVTIAEPDFYAMERRLHPQLQRPKLVPTNQQRHTQRN